MYSVAQFAKQVGGSVKTLQRWDREGRLKAKRTLSGRRYYDEADLATALNLPQRPAVRRTVAYCRVSSPAQRPDLQNQRAALESYAVSKHVIVDYGNRWWSQFWTQAVSGSRRRDCGRGGGALAHRPSRSLGSLWLCA